LLLKIAILQDRIIVAFCFMRGFGWLRLYCKSASDATLPDDLGMKRSRPSGNAGPDLGKGPASDLAGARLGSGTRQFSARKMLGERWAESLWTAGGPGVRIDDQKGSRISSACWP